MRIAYFVMKYPTLSQTFIEREMRALAKQGLEIVIYPCFDFRKATVSDHDPELKVVRTPLLKVIRNAIVELSRIAKTPRGRKQIKKAVSAFLRHRARHPEGLRLTLLGTLYGLSQTQHLREQTHSAQRLHAAWATAPATAAMVAAHLTDLPFSFGAHAYDLFRHGGDPLLPIKLKKAQFVHTTTQAAADHLENFPNRCAEVVLARRGLTDLPELGFVKQTLTKNPIRILSVGRLVEKKGHVFQLAACAQLKQKGIPFHLTIVGDGPLADSLTRRTKELNLENEVTFTGAFNPAEVAQAYRTTDIFWHTGIVDTQGDRDGLPNVVPEAMSYGLPVISTSAGGAAEAIKHKQNGLVVQSAGDIPALVKAVTLLADDFSLRLRLGEAARQWVEEHFIAEKNTRQLARRFLEMADPAGVG